MQKISCSYLLAAFLVSIPLSAGADKLPEKENPKGGWAYLHPEDGEYTEDDPDDPGRKDRVALCDAIKDRLNQYSYPDPVKARTACGFHATLAYPAFSEPPWQELDPEEHYELLWKLFKYRGQGSAGYFGRGFKYQDWMPDERYKQEAKDFIAQGGRMQLWRTHLLSQLDDKPAPPDLQNIIQLRYKLDSKVVNETCPNMPTNSWNGSLYVVNDDLSGPDPRVTRDSTLSSFSLVLFNKEPHFVAGDLWEVDIAKDLGTGPAYFCQIRHSTGVK